MTPTEQARAALEALAEIVAHAKYPAVDMRQAQRLLDRMGQLAREASALLEPLGERPADWVGEWVAPTVKPAGKPLP
jgi:hypothetical protein